MEDWQQASDYQFTSGLKGVDWAWQFLRRNRIYQTEFEQALIGFTSEPKPPDLGWIPDDPLDPDFFIPTPFESRAQTHWGIPGFFNPAQSQPAGLMVFPFDMDTGYARAGEAARGNPSALKTNRPLSLVLKANQVAVVFDLSKPLVRQLEGTKRQLQFEQQQLSERGIIEVSRQRRRNRGLWTIYLRLLDADLKGVGPGEFAKKVAYDRRKPKVWKKLNSNTAWATLQEARKMTFPDHYRTLCF